MNAFELIAVSNNLGDSKSLATHPATTTHMRIGAEERAKLGITDGVIRLSVGLEDLEDLKDDLAQALARRSRMPRRHAPQIAERRHVRAARRSVASRSLRPAGTLDKLAAARLESRSTEANAADGVPWPRTYSKITRDVRVTVRSFYLEDQSQPDESHYVWAYRVKIENQGREPVQLLRRTWQITDARGRTQHVHGAGVVGEQPLLEPGESFEYTSGTPLDTPSGFMVGAYHMVVPSSGENFDVAIPAFSLDSPHQSGRVH